MNTIIVTGATSMLGLALIDKCISQNINVIAVVRPDSLKRKLIPRSSGITIIEQDLSKLYSFDPSGIRADLFYHFAWEHTEARERNNVVAQSKNIGYTLDAVQLAKRMSCKKFIGVGSQAEYGRVKGAISPNIPVAPETAYGLAKYTAGRLSALLCDQLEISHIWTRVFSTYGIHDMPSTMVMYCIDTLLKGEKPLLTKCEQLWDYLNCKDAANAFYLIGKKGKAGTIYNIGSGIAKPLTEYVNVIRDEIDPQLPLSFGEKEYALKQVMYLCADISKLQQDTGFMPSILFKDGIRETINWYRSRSNEDN